MNRLARTPALISRRRLLGAGALFAGSALLPTGFATPARAEALSVTLADIGVGDPNGDWSRFTAETGNSVNLVAMGNAPSAVVNQLLAGGGQATFDIINIVGGMQKPLVEAGLISEIDTSKLPNWEKNSYISQYLAPGTPGFDFIGFDGKLYGVPTVLQADSFAYLPDQTGELDSYAALFDPRFRGFVALEDNYTTAGQKTALYLKSAGLAQIENPANLTPDELKAVIDFLIERKKEGQFRVLWSSFEQAVNLLVSGEVHVMDCWEPMVFAAAGQGVNVRYAAPKEGYLLWAMAAYLVNNPDRSPEQTEAAYALLNFMLSPWYGATITGLRGYLTNPAAAEFASANPDLFAADHAQRIADISKGVQDRYAVGGTWQNRWPTNVDLYEEEWQRFKAA